ncbi:cytochrome C oxidase assembly protein [Elstera litoralis]|uniref:Cytochrome c oxidase assembly protein CtaG n=1 Tax=Elstera litoralis TaxID=552518 RepID=A0A0F3IW16_9PROT|nr:cytochrome c oxidase assembly protein [Elstera litoralis]KJV10945.1 cytochrome C oxidase assembly protein [Elstera litoralis]
MSAQGSDKRNRRTLLSLAMLATGMLCLAYAAVPLYQMFCQVTGFGGATTRAETASTHTAERVIMVRFDANTDAALPWRFEPVQRSVAVKLGENSLIFYRAKNLSKEPITGIASFNVTPLKTGGVFSKVACFCFDEQTLQPGEEIEMPVSFYIDPAMADDRTLADVKTITLSYTFFRAKAQTAAAAGPKAAAGG